MFCKEYKPPEKTFWKNILLNNFSRICILTGGVVFLTSKNIAFCKVKTTRMVGYRSSSDKHLSFNWKQFWLYLKPYIGYFIAAVLVKKIMFFLGLCRSVTFFQGALAVAVLNVYIPKIMGDLINVISKVGGSTESQSFVEKAKTPVLKLVAMYIAQVNK